MCWWLCWWHCSAWLLDIVCWWQTLFSMIVGHCLLVTGIVQHDCWTLFVGDRHCLAWLLVIVGDRYCSAWLLDIVCWWLTLFSMIVGHCLLMTNIVQHDCWTLFVGCRHCSAWLLDIVCWWQTLFSMILGHRLLVTGIVQHDCWTLFVICHLSRLHFSLSLFF